jgi:hypothetical protein
VAHRAGLVMPPPRMKKLLQVVWRGRIGKGKLGG